MAIEFGQKAVTGGDRRSIAIIPPIPERSQMGKEPTRNSSAKKCRTVEIGQQSPPSMASVNKAVRAGPRPTSADPEATTP